MVVVLSHMLDYDLANSKTMSRDYTYLPLIERSSRHRDVISMKLEQIKAVDSSNSKHRWCRCNDV